MLYQNLIKLVSEGFTNGYYYKKSEFNFEFQGNRFVQLMQVMKDLDLLKGGAE